MLESPIKLPETQTVGPVMTTTHRAAGNEG